MVAIKRNGKNFELYGKFFHPEREEWLLVAPIQILFESSDKEVETASGNPVGEIILEHRSIPSVSIGIRPYVYIKPNLIFLSSAGLADISQGVVSLDEVTEGMKVRIGEASNDDPEGTIILPENNTPDNLIDLEAIGTFGKTVKGLLVDFGEFVDDSLIGSPVVIKINENQYKLLGMLSLVGSLSDFKALVYPGEWIVKPQS